MWFSDLTGFSESSPEFVRENLTRDGEVLISKVNGARLVCGTLEIPSLAELRARCAALTTQNSPTTVEEVIADVKHLHQDRDNAGALFQVASQFNLLEMALPDRTPEEGVGIYENDPTQGPACAVAAGAGTIYRNYFVPVGARIGQNSDHQIDCLQELGAALENEDDCHWRMKNGYALANAKGLERVTDILTNSTEFERDNLRALLRVGFHRNTQVTLPGAEHLVSQVYCSALPVSYSDHPPELWTEFAKLILEATYEAAFCCAVLNKNETSNNTLFLTLVGGGAFGNEDDWIIGALHRALHLHKDAGLQVCLVSHRKHDPRIAPILSDWPTIK